jgi:uncharacterized protein YbdZ (MbtH family)
MLRKHCRDYAVLHSHENRYSCNVNFFSFYIAMANFTIHLKSVYSKTVETPEGITLPQGWQLSWHQAETFRLLDRTDIDIIFNTAMTGDGKVLCFMTAKNLINPAPWQPS